MSSHFATILVVVAGGHLMVVRGYQIIAPSDRGIARTFRYSGCAEWHQLFEMRASRRAILVLVEHLSRIATPPCRHLLLILSLVVSLGLILLAESLLRLLLHKLLR